MSERYEFTLDSVLHYRKIQKELGLVALHEARMSRDDVRYQLQACQERIRRLEAEPSERPASFVLDVRQELIRQSFLRCLRLEADRLETVLRERESTVERKRTEVVERSQDERVLERVRSREEAQFQLDFRRQEAARLDEVAVLRHRPDRSTH